MELWQKILQAYPELTFSDFDPVFGIINLANDADGIGDYIAKWEYSQPIPEGLKLGK